MTVSIVRRKITTHNLPASLHPVLARVYAARNVKSSLELDCSLEYLHPYDTLLGIDKAVELLIAALCDDKHILIIGDFDADGATSCALAVRALRLMGARHVTYLVPNRFQHGYGLTPEIVVVAAQQKPDLIVTVDNGMSSIEGVVSAKQRGIQVLVTDHHLPGKEPPPADAIVNPHQDGDEFPSKHLAGVGVIFYVMLALRAQLRRLNWFRQRAIQEPNLARLLDLVALGTVADVVPLDHNNRILVHQGLARIRRGSCCAGISALCAISGRRQARMIASDLSFALGPRLNAAGRLQDMSFGIGCLLCDDNAQAYAMAQRLDQLNRERREIEAKMQDQALVGLEKMRLDDQQDDLPLGLCLFDPDWHQGVVGILAARIKERLHRPVIAFAPASDGEVKGSARSVQGVHIRDALDNIAARHPELLTKFGGHAMAAGLLIKRAHLEKFRAAFDEEIRNHLDPEELHGIIQSDGQLDPENINLELAELLRGAGPWGQAFPEPVFDGEFEVLNRRTVGGRHLKMVLKTVGSQLRSDAIAFNTQDSDWPSGTERVLAAYRLDVNEYQGRQSAQLIIEHIEPR